MAQNFDLKTTISRFYEQPVAKVALELFLSLAAVILFALVAIKPTLLTMSDLLKSIDDKKELNQQLAQKIVALSSAQDFYLIFQDKLYVLNQAVPVNSQVSKTLKIIEKLAGEQNLIIYSLKVNDLPKDVDENNSLESLTRINTLLSVTVAGEYPAIRQLVEELKNSRRTMLVEKITFSVDDKRGEKTLKATILVNTPYYGINYGQSVSETAK
jgi:hypothetical protein